MKGNKKVYGRGIDGRFSVYLKQDTTDELIDWLNQQDNVSMAVVEVLEQYVSGELIPINSFKKIEHLLASNNPNISKNTEVKEVPKEITNNKNADVMVDNIEDNASYEKNDILNKKEDEAEPIAESDPVIYNEAPSIFGDKEKVVKIIENKDDAEDEEPLIEFSYTSGTGINKVTGSD